MRETTDFTDNADLTKEDEAQIIHSYSGQRSPERICTDGHDGRPLEREVYHVE